jgi:hypothetical protein
MGQNLKFFGTLVGSVNINKNLPMDRLYAFGNVAIATMDLGSGKE